MESFGAVRNSQAHVGIATLVLGRARGPWRFWVGIVLRLIWVFFWICVQRSSGGPRRNRPINSADHSTPRRQANRHPADKPIEQPSHHRPRVRVINIYIYNMYIYIHLFEPNATATLVHTQGLLHVRSVQTYPSFGLGPRPVAATPKSARPSIRPSVRCCGRPHQLSQPASVRSHAKQPHIIYLARPILNPSAPCLFEKRFPKKNP